MNSRRHRFRCVSEAGDFLAADGERDDVVASAAVEALEYHSQRLDATFIPAASDPNYTVDCDEPVRRTRFGATPPTGWLLGISHHNTRAG